MQISASLRNSGTGHEVVVETSGQRRTIAIPAKDGGDGSAVNGGELLMAALATCYCNDLYREARRQGLRLDGVEVEASADFDDVGLAARDIRYRARVDSPAAAADIERLLDETDAVAEIHNTVRSGSRVTRLRWSDAV